jgi:hypothetical protein
VGRWKGANGRRDGEVVLPCLGSKCKLGGGNARDGWEREGWAARRPLVCHDLAMTTTTTAFDTASTTPVRALLFDTNVHLGVSQQQLSSPKERDGIYQRHVSTCFFGAHIKGWDPEFHGWDFRGFLSRRNIPTRAYKKRSACRRWKGWPRHGKIGLTDVGYSAWFSLRSIYQDRRTGPAQWHGANGHLGFARLI